MTATTAGYRVAVTSQGVGVVSEANRRDHWAVKRARRLVQQGQTLASLLRIGDDASRRIRNSPAIRVRLVRLGGKRLDSDNLAGGFKAIRDAVAGWLKIDDGSDRYRWDYDQEPAKEKGFRIEFTVD
ncbi:MAG TPA: hypothetical protein VD866_22210 [Urbifossiella sp.]|nr:hypothetical protein [Urbifossiella sp.]